MSIFGLVSSLTFSYYLILQLVLQEDLDSMKSKVLVYLVNFAANRFDSLECVVMSSSEILVLSNTWRVLRK